MTGLRGWRLFRLVIATFLGWAVFVGGTIVLSPATAEAQGLSCDANGDGDFDGSYTTEQSNGNDDLADAYHDDLVERLSQDGPLTQTQEDNLRLDQPDAGYRIELRVCVETDPDTGEILRIPHQALGEAIADEAGQWHAAALAQAQDNLALHQPGWNSAPHRDEIQFVGLETWLWTAEHHWDNPVVSTATVGEVTVTVNATPARSVWQFSDLAQPVICGQGTEWNEGLVGTAAPCGRHWEHTTSIGPISVEVFLEYDLAWDSNLSGSSFDAPTGEATGPNAGEFQLNVGEVQTIGTEGAELLAPTDRDVSTDAVEGTPPPEPPEQEESGCDTLDIICHGTNAGGAIIDAGGATIDLIEDGADATTDFVVDTAVDIAEAAEDAFFTSINFAGDVAVTFAETAVDGFVLVGEVTVDGVVFIVEELIPEEALILIESVISAIQGCSRVAQDAIGGVVGLIEQGGQLLSDPSGFLEEKWTVVTELQTAIEEDPEAFFLEFGESVIADALYLDLYEQGEDDPQKYVEWAAAIACDLAVSVLTGGGAFFAKLTARYAGGLDEFVDIIQTFNRRDRNNDNDRTDNDGSDNDPNNNPNVCRATSSFLTGTQVLLSDGTHRNIEDIRPGNTVVAYNTETEQWSDREVTDQWSYLDTDQIADITLTDGSQVSATDHHLFWTTNSPNSGGEWIEAEHLQPGDLLLTPEGVTTVDHINIWDSNPTLVWELTVDIDHTFTVAAGNNDVLVHNQDRLCRRDFDDLDPETRRLINENWPPPPLLKDNDSAFNDWWDELTPDELDAILTSNDHFDSLGARIRQPGGLHEWCLVCQQRRIKDLGISMSQIRDFRTATEALDWVVPDDFPDGGLPGSRGNLGSTRFHNELRDIVESASTVEDLLMDIDRLADRWSVDDLPDWPEPR